MDLKIEKIVDEYSERLLLYAKSILGNWQDAEDVVQEVFMAAHEKFGFLKFVICQLGYIE